MDSYASEYPDADVDPAFKRFFEEFYAISDTPHAHERYAQQFTEDATLIMASKKVKGSSGAPPPCLSGFHSRLTPLTGWPRNPPPERRDVGESR